MGRHSGVQLGPDDAFNCIGKPSLHLLSQNCKFLLNYSSGGVSWGDETREALMRNSCLPRAGGTAVLSRLVAGQIGDGMNYVRPEICSTSRTKFL